MFNSSLLGRITRIPSIRIHYTWYVKYKQAEITKYYDITLLNCRYLILTTFLFNVHKVMHMIVLSGEQVNIHI